MGCWEDAAHATKLKPDCLKGWTLSAKALAKQGSPILAKHVVSEALAYFPGNSELLLLNSEIDRWSSSFDQKVPATMGRSCSSVASFRPAVKPPRPLALASSGS